MVRNGNQLQNVDWFCFLHIDCDWFPQEPITLWVLVSNPKLDVFSGKFRMGRI